MCRKLSYAVLALVVIGIKLMQNGIGINVFAFDFLPANMSHADIKEHVGGVLEKPRVFKIECN